jgi:hypothetical protein
MRIKSDKLRACSFSMMCARFEIRGIEQRQLDSSLRRTGDFRLRPVERPSALLGLAIDVSALTN